MSATMSATVRPTAVENTRYEPTVLPAGPILIASDTTSHSDAAFPIAQVMAARTNAAVRVVSVLRPFALPMFGIDAVAVPLEPEQAVRERRADALRRQVESLTASETPWPIDVVPGEPAHELVEFARQTRARMIIVGRGRHAAVERMLEGELVLRLLQLGDVPVLATEPGLTHLPRRVVIATDFSEFSLYAAQVAMSVVAPDATVFLANVGPAYDATDAVLHPHAVAYREQAHNAFRTMRDALTHDDLHFEEVLLTGNASDEIVAFATEAKADLVVLATHGYGFMRRMILGSVTAACIRRAPCSVLAVPGPARTVAAARARTLGASVTRTFAPVMLDQELQSFTERNAGRPCTVEIDQLDMGAQILGRQLPLVGIARDTRSRSTSLMFGASQLEGQHMSHAMPDVTGVELSTDGEGRDHVLRFVHSTGQTLVTMR